MSGTATQTSIQQSVVTGVSVAPDASIDRVIVPRTLRTLDFHRDRWAEVLQLDWPPQFDWRVETDSEGALIVSPPPSRLHEIIVGACRVRLEALLNGRSFFNWGVTTRLGVKVPDVAWFENGESIEPDADGPPEIVIEVLSPGNTDNEMAEKRLAYFSAGVGEVWIVDAEGRIAFFHHATPDVVADRSVRCPEFTGQDA